MYISLESEFQKSMENQFLPDTKQILKVKLFQIERTKRLSQIMKDSYSKYLNQYKRERFNNFRLGKYDFFCFCLVLSPPKKSADQK